MRERRGLLLADGDPRLVFELGILIVVELAQRVDLALGDVRRDHAAVGRHERGQRNRHFLLAEAEEAAGTDDGEETVVDLHDLLDVAEDFAIGADDVVIGDFLDGHLTLARRARIDRHGLVVGRRAVGCRRVGRCVLGGHALLTVLAGGVALLLTIRGGVFRALHRRTIGVLIDDLRLALLLVDGDLGVLALIADLRALLGLADLNIGVGLVDRDVGLLVAIVGRLDRGIAGIIDGDPRLALADRDFRLRHLDIDIRVGHADGDGRLRNVDADRRRRLVHRDGRLRLRDRDVRIGLVDPDVGLRNVDLHRGSIRLDNNVSGGICIHAVVVLSESGAGQCGACKKSDDENITHVILPFYSIGNITKPPVEISSAG
ncbi:hypothetical protein SI859A1_00766 [Aurantimonas manganoxydans SI85-9A1]|uniref:NAD-specific glutamate dehydrogenase n=1 Tax=Aurantimonas manganoxydans (strain ATCC BAA-1229 / DSM 21871 / SI85-9A1) TaxID=287752 RepID=Q1YK77_AURMS|nr:hypothetical protein SI859A1_00766 [Aurantimonas manganoxydans SI85-9A1]